MRKTVTEFLKEVASRRAGKPSLEQPILIRARASGPAARLTPTERLKVDAIDKAIADFTAVMREKMLANLHKKDAWRTIPIEQMWDYARQEFRELRLAMDYETAPEAQKECADVANFMMMLFHKLPAEGTKAERARKAGGNF